jgi:outer membrane protein OmpA-like peptidoglycan-associated protein
MRWPRSAEAAVAFVAAIALLGGCATPPPPPTRVGTVVLLPEKDGGATALTVRQGERTLILDKPYAAADLTTAGPRAYQASAADVQARFGAALAAQPPRPVRFTLYFVTGTNALTDESKRALEAMFAELAVRPVPDIVVVGHTDRVGTDPFNDALALQRAEAVRATLIGRGIAPQSVVAAGRGKREPAVPTPDGVPEPLNRRVEIYVR